MAKKKEAKKKIKKKEQPVEDKPVDMKDVPYMIYSKEDCPRCRREKNE